MYHPEVIWNNPFVRSTLFWGLIGGLVSGRYSYNETILFDPSHRHLLILFNEPEVIKAYVKVFGPFKKRYHIGISNKVLMR